MSKPKTPRDIQVRHRLSGAALLGVKEPNPPAMAIDAAPRAGDPRFLVQAGYGFRAPRPGDEGRPVYAAPRITIGDEELPPVVTEIDDE